MIKLFSRHGIQAYESFPNNTNPKWWLDPGLRASVFVIIGVYAVQAAGGYDKSLITTLQSLPSWTSAMGSPDAQTLGLITVSLNLGGILAAVPSQIMMDRYGRKFGLLFGMCFLLVGAAIQTAANGLGMFIGGRALIGAGIAASLTAAPVLCQELAHPRMRGTIASMYNTIWYVGAIFVSWIGFGTSHMTNTSWAWRLPTLGQAGSIIYVLCALPFIPESPRWLISKGRNEEALRILAKYHSNGVEEDPLVQFEFNEIKEVLRREATETSTWAEALGTPGNRKRFLMITAVSVFTNWNGQSIVSYYLAAVLKLVGITSPTQQTGINGGLQIFNWLTSILGAGLAESLGRRKLWLSSFIIMLMACIIQTAVTATYTKSPSTSVGGAVIFAIFLYDFGFNIACNPLLYAYEVEIMPFHLRAKGLAWSVTIGNIQGVASQYSNPIGMANLGWKYYLVYMAFLVLEIIGIYFFFIETRGRTLEEVAAMFDGEDALKAVEAAGAQVEIDEKNDVETRVVPA